MPTLLLADDSSSMGRSVERALDGAGVRVLSVLSGERAIEAIENHPPSIVLADIGMARVSGYDVASYVKNSPAFARIPVLLLAGPFDRVDEARARATGCDGVVVKPFDPRLLAELVQGLLAGQPVASSLAWPANLPRVDAWDGAHAAAALAALDARGAAPQEDAEAEEHVSSWIESNEALAESAAVSSDAFDAGLDELDAALDSTTAQPTLLHETAAADFEHDMNVLRGSFQGGSRNVRAGISSPVPAPPPSLPLSLDNLASAERVAPVTLPDAEPRHLKIKIKIGATEFEAEGPADFVQAQFEEFKRLAARESNVPQDSPVSAPPRRRVAHAH